MKHFSKLAMGFIMAGVMMFAIGCYQDDEILINNELPEAAESASPMTIQTSVRSLNFVPPYSVYCYRSNRNNKIIGDPGTYYAWQIRDRFNELTQPYVKFFGPDETVNFIPMYKDGDSWYLFKDLIKCGRYYWRYTEGKDNYAENLTAWNSYIDNVPVRTGDDYPWSGQTSGDCDPDTWGFCKHNCTSWVAWKVNQMWNIARGIHANHFTNKMVDGTNINRLGHVNRWKSKLSMLGYESNNTPVVGCIAYWDAGHPADSQYGHVAFVTAIYSNGSIRIEEYNVNYHAYSMRIIYPGDIWYPDSFIHVQYER